MHYKEKLANWLKKEDIIALQEVSSIEVEAF